MRFEDYYAILGLAPDADPLAVKPAYRRLARLHHPDLHPSAESHASMLKINEAYEVLSDVERRKAYDGVRRRHRRAMASQTPAAADAGATDSSDLPADWKQGFQFEGTPTAGSKGQNFTDFFTSMFGRASKPEQPAVQHERGADEHVALAIDPQDALEGAVRSVTMRRLASDEHGYRAVLPRQVQVQIPKGIKAGQHIRLSGQGSAGRGGADAGDLYVEIQFKPASPAEPNPDVQGTLPLAPWEAALGSEITTATPAGPVRVAVPPDTPHGKRLRLKGRGRADGLAGDLLLEVQVVLPPSTLPGATAVYQTMEAALGSRFNPRPSGQD